MVRRINTLRYFGVVWAVIGISLIFAYAIFRLTPHFTEALNAGFSFGNWITLLLWCVFMLLSEGYFGFQKQFSPRFAARALYLFNNPRPSHLLLAPIFCAGFINTTKRRKLSIWILSFGILLLVIGVKYIAQPWRGIIDIGVILGLLYGLVTIYYLTIKTMVEKKYLVDPEVCDVKHLTTF
jgi:hypothetical protein